MFAALDMSPGVFYDNGDGYVMPIEQIKFRAPLSPQRLPLTSMFDIYLLESEGHRVGFLFKSQFQVTNNGGYLLTNLRNKGKATEVEVLIKNENLVVYHYPNKGTLAIAAKVNAQIAVILEEQ